MILYDKKSFAASPKAMARALEKRVAGVLKPALQETREWLVFAGQLEQGILDDRIDLAPLVAGLTRAAAEVFLDTRGGLDPRPSRERFRFLLREAAQRFPALPVDIRIPEGFAWYALYPDSYAQTAERWARVHAIKATSVSVIGVRSIGTSLAAVVAETLRRCGVAQVTSFTVRPFGPPFKRKVELPPNVMMAHRFIVVDEGPGLSGSSMAAVAGALVKAGAAPASIFFFAGHDHGPGQAGDEEAQRWWSADRVWSTAAMATTMAGAKLPEALGDAVQNWLGEPLAETPAAFSPARTGLPRASAPALEAPKLMARTISGKMVLLKFAGFAAIDANLTTLNGNRQARETRLAKAGFAVAPLGAAHGWVATPWLNGVYLQAADATAAFIHERLAPYIIAAAVKGLGDHDSRLGIERIAAALMAFCRERGADEPIDAIENARHHAIQEIGGCPLYGDGRLAPHKWVRTPMGEVLKLDAAGHDCDHSWAGRQSIWWDVAGAQVEWHLDDARSRLLEEAVRSTGGVNASAATLALYRAGYCALRLAMALHSANSFEERSPQHGSLRRAATSYESRLKSELGLLQRESCANPSPRRGLALARKS